VISPSASLPDAPGRRRCVVFWARSRDSLQVMPTFMVPIPQGRPPDDLHRVFCFQGVPTAVTCLVKDRHEVGIRGVFSGARSSSFPVMRIVVTGLFFLYWLG